MVDLTSFYSVIKVSGSDMAVFLQGQLTCDINLISLEKAAFAAHCNPKGRMVSLFYCVRWGDAIYLIMPSSIARKAMRALSRYIVTSDVTLAQVDRYQIIGYIDKQPTILEKPKDKFAVTQNEHACLIHVPGQRLLLLSVPSLLGESHADQSIANWQRCDIEQNMVWLTPETAGELIPNEINLAQHGGVSLQKGCYVGQEIIMRMHALGKSKKRLYPIKIKINTKQCPTPGETIFASNPQTSEKLIDAGKLICFVHQDDTIYGLALLNINSVAEQRPLSLAAGVVNVM